MYTKEILVFLLNNLVIMNWYKKANLWDDISKHGPNSPAPLDINDPKVEWLANYLGVSKEKALQQMSGGYASASEFLKKNYFANQYSWSVPSKEAIEKLKNFIGNDMVLEVGAGHGMWAKLMQEAGINVRATDAFSSPQAHGYLGRTKEQFFTDVEDLSGVEAVQKYGDASILMTSWPPYNEPFAFNVLKAFKGNKLIFIGEGRWGCTANDDFFNLLDEQWEEIESINIPQWEGMHDALYLYKRK